MAIYTIVDLITAIATTLGAAPSLVRTQHAGTSVPPAALTEGMADHPTLQVYPEENTTADWTGETDRVSLSGKHSIKEYMVYADLLVNPRANIGEDMARLLPGIDDLENILDNQKYRVSGVGAGLFGRRYITSFQWSWRRVEFDYAGAKYVGARFILIVRTGTEV